MVKFKKIVRKKVSHNTGSLPKEFKLANVVPIHKKDSRQYGFLNLKSCSTNMISFTDKAGKCRSNSQKRVQG